MTFFSSPLGLRISLAALASLCPILSFGQAVSSSSTAVLLTFQQEQQSLLQEQQALLSQGATPQQFQAWIQQNASRLAAQQQRAQALSAASNAQPWPLAKQLPLPATLSPMLSNLLTTQTALANVHAQLHNQEMATQAGQSPTPAQKGQIHEQEEQQFEQQNVSTLTLQAQQAQTLGEASAQASLPLPPPLQLPPNITPQLAAYLVLHDQMMREQIQVRNQYVAATPVAREAALQQWEQQNAGRVQQLQEQAEALSQSSAVIQN